MLTPEAAEEVPAFVAETNRQYARIKGALPGLQLIRAGERGSQVMLICSTETFYEGVVIGQLPQVVIERVGSPRNPVRRDMADAKKPVDKRRIALTDADIDAVLARWQRGESALGLPFLTHVYGRDGKIATRR